MWKTLTFLFGAACLLCSSALYAQEIQVSDPRLELRDNTIFISYDILNSTPADKFTVELIVTDSKGKRIKATSLEGDVGKLVYGGYNKRIAWDLEVDKIVMNAQIFVKVNVNAIPPPKPVVVEPVVQEAEEEPQETIEDKVSKEKKQFSRTGLLLQSVAFPGLGLSRYKGGPHWIKGVAGYGCIAGAVIMNRQAISTYEEINDLADFDDKDALYKKSMQQDNISEVLGYTAIAIWVSDMVWTILGSADLKMSSHHNQRLKINSRIDPVSNAPMLAFTYKF